MYVLVWVFIHSVMQERILSDCEYNYENFPILHFRVTVLWKHFLQTFYYIKLLYSSIYLSAELGLLTTVFLIKVQYENVNYNDGKWRTQGYNVCLWIFPGFVRLIAILRYIAYIQRLSMLSCPFHRCWSYRLPPWSELHFWQEMNVCRQQLARVSVRNTSLSPLWFHSFCVFMHSLSSLFIIMVDFPLSPESILILENCQCSLTCCSSLTRYKHSLSILSNIFCWFSSTSY